jgi:hypothetical protein
MTPRQIAGWSSIYMHEDAARDRTMLTLLRVAQHADAKGYKEFIKKMEKNI